MISQLQFLCGIWGNADFETRCVYVATVWTGEQREHIKRSFDWHFHDIIICDYWVCQCVHLCVTAVWDSLADGWLNVCGVSKRGGGTQRHQALSIIHPACHHGNLPEGGQGSVRTSGNLWGVNLNRRETTTEGREEGDEEDDRWQARIGEREKCRGRVDNEESVRWREGWQVIVAVGVTGSRRQTEERMRRCIDIPHRAVSSHLRGSLWLQTLPFTLTLYVALSILWLPPVDQSAENGHTTDCMKTKLYSILSQLSISGFQDASHVEIFPGCQLVSHGFQ